MNALRSDAWLDGDDEVAMLHRVALAQTNYRRGRPVIGIAATSSAFNPCHGDVDRLVKAAAGAVDDAGGVAAVFPAMSLGEDLMKPSAMMYRNLLSMELEETIRSSPIDGLVIFTGCDKNVPAALMALASADVPALIGLVGLRQPGRFEDRRVAAGTDIWRELERRRSGQTSDSEWAAFERSLRETGPGICNVMGTAVTMGLIAEVLGMALPGSTTMQAGGDEIQEAARATGRLVVEMVTDAERPSHRMTREAFDNALTILAAVGGSTNAIIHLVAVAGRLGLRLDLEAVDAVFSRVPLIADIEPCGSQLAQDLHDAGTTPALVDALGTLFDHTTICADGRPWSEVMAPPTPGSSAIRATDDPIAEAPAIAILHGSLAPGGAVIKVAAASPELLRCSGPAVVFDDYHDMRRRLDDPGLQIEADSVIVVRECGPAGAPGMPEWGMAPIPKRLVDMGVTDMLRVSDGRMSGTSFGTVVLHVTPEAHRGGPLALVQDGDTIELDLPARRIDLVVDDDTLSSRRAAWSAPISAHERGWPAMYQQHVGDATSGCDLDFLVAPGNEQPVFVEPVVGRS